MIISKEAIRIKQADLNMTQYMLADKAGISRQGLSALLARGTAKPETVKKLAAALDLNPADIIREQ